MSDYRVKTGHDEDLVDLVRLQPQPTSTGVQVTRRVASGDGTIHDQGLYLELIWPMRESESDYLALLTAFGLHNQATAAVTVHARDQRWQYRRYNGLAVLPEMGAGARWANYFPRNITILIRNLEPLA